jgi:hypothetical protein
MAYNGINDIAFIEKSAEEKIDIENTCRACSEFGVVSTINEVPVLEHETITTTPVELLNPTCNNNNIVLVFSQLKKFQVCPQGKW